MFNPMNGQQTADYFGWKGVPYLWGAGWGPKANKLLTSEESRNKLISKYLKDEFGKPSTKKSIKSIIPVASGASSSTNKENK